MVVKQAQSIFSLGGPENFEGCSFQLKNELEVNI